jgi:uncharacterized membrane protein
MKGYLTVGLAAAAGVALFEAALIPGLVIGGAAVLAPSYLPKLRRGLQPAFDAMTRPWSNPPAATAKQSGTKAVKAKPVVAKLGIKQAIAKTITFRIIVTTLDFTSNYVVIGELTTAASLSTFNLIFGPLFYLTHEAAWNYLGPAEDTAITVQLPAAFRFGSQDGTNTGQSIVMSRALAKTITFRTVATIIDFGTIYLVVGSAATAAALSAFGFVVGPFVYIGHEKLWDYYGGSAKDTADGPETMKLLPAPA